MKVNDEEYKNVKLYQSLGNSVSMFTAKKKLRFLFTRIAHCFAAVILDYAVIHASIVS